MEEDESEVYEVEIERGVCLECIWRSPDGSSSSSQAVTTSQDPVEAAEALVRIVVATAGMQGNDYLMATLDALERRSKGAV